jgi:2-iminoacetate synthase
MNEPAVNLMEKNMERGLPKVESEGLTSFIPEEEISRLLETTGNPAPARVREIIAKSLAKNRLDPEEMAVLINTDDPELVDEIFEGARELKRRIYGNRIVLFAPLYIGNECINNCEYCGFRASNREITRKTLNREELDCEVKALVDRGHKRLIMVYGEHPSYDAQYIHDTVRQAYDNVSGNGEIRRININAAPLDVEGFNLVKSAGIGTYQIFQETYHRDTYEKVHPSGPKSDYLWRLHGLDRAQQAGIDDVGIGALMGLYDWRFETMGLLYHTIHLEEAFGVGPHTISFPRIEPAIGTALCDRPPHEVNDYDFKRLVAILRLAVPYTGLILTCRESVELRNEIIQFGVSQIDAGSNIGIGAYSQQDEEAYRKSQFVLNDGRSLDQVIRELCEADLIPSFCTGCYRLGRTGEHFMEFAVPGFVKRFCTPNAVLTFLEYMEDYSSPETLKAGMKQIARELDRMPNSEQKSKLLERMTRIRQGSRDLFF